jgi:hypothetical protein
MGLTGPEAEAPVPSADASARSPATGWPPVGLAPRMVDESDVADESELADESEPAESA